MILSSARGFPRCSCRSLTAAKPRPLSFGSTFIEFEDRRIGGPDLAKLREENSGKFLGQVRVERCRGGTPGQGRLPSRPSKVLHVHHPTLILLLSPTPTPTPTSAQLPVLLVDDVWYTQSNAQYRYAGKLAGLYPENAQEALRVRLAVPFAHATSGLRQGAGASWLTLCRRPTPFLPQVDELLDIINELIGKVPQNPDAEEKQKLRDAWAKDGFVKYAKYIDSVLSSEWAVGDKMSIADLALTGVVASVAGGLWDGIPGDIFDSYKNIKRVFDKTSALEAVKPWMK